MPLHQYRRYRVFLGRKRGNTGWCRLCRANLVYMGIAINAHYDGKVIVPDEPLDLPPNQPLLVRIESISGDTLPEESALTWIAENSCERPHLPSDLSHQHDHYLYGVPKKDL